MVNYFVYCLDKNGNENIYNFIYYTKAKDSAIRDASCQNKTS